MTIRPFILLLIGALVIAGAVVVPAPAAHAATFTVSTTADTNDGTCDADCSLREAIVAANSAGGADVITFGVDGTFTLGSNLPNVTGDLTVTGNGVGTTIIDGAGAFRSLFRVGVAGLDVTVQNLEAANGFVAGFGFGGALDFDSAGGTLTLSDVLLRDGVAGYGGAVNADDGTIIVRDSIIRGNVGTVVNGGIWASSAVTVLVVNSLLTGNSGPGGALFSNGGVLEVAQSTIVGNSASSTFAAGVESNGGTLTIRNSVIADNTGVGGDCDAGATTAITFTLIASGDCGIVDGVAGNIVAPAALTPQFRPTALSPAVNAGDNAAIPSGVTLDLAGATRIQRGTVDLGAYESTAPFDVSITAVAASAAEGGSGALTFRFTRDVVDVDPLTVTFAVSGTASAADFTPGAGTTIVIPGGATQVDLVLTPVADGLDEANETVILTLAAGAGYTPAAPLAASATIVDVPTLPATGRSPAGAALAGLALLALGLALTMRSRRVASPQPASSR